MKYRTVGSNRDSNDNVARDSSCYCDWRVVRGNCRFDRYRSLLC